MKSNMNLWHPITPDNSLLDGRRAASFAQLWNQLLWETAQYHALPRQPVVLKARLRRGHVAHVISADPRALALEPGQCAVPIAMPSFAGNPRITLTGFLWLVVPRGEISPVALPRDCPRPVVPMPPLHHVCQSPETQLP